jgi:hypothetical protein
LRKSLFFFQQKECPTKRVFTIRYPVSYLLIFVLVVTAVLQIKYLNKALQRFDSTEVIPTQFVLFTVSAIIGSAVLYHDFDGMDMEQMSRFMSGCAIEFLGVYLITSKRVKHSHSPALSISADSGTAISFSDEEALDRVNLLPSDRLHTLPTHASNNGRKRSSVLASTGAALSGRSTQPINTPSFEAWQEANPHINLSNSMNSNHRRSSVFRGISMASQLLDRNDENQQQPIQLPISSSPNTSYHRTNRIVPEPSSSTSAIGNIISGITSAITSHTHHDPTLAAEEADAVEIDIPTSFHHSENLLDRELMPINNMNNKRPTKLVDIEEHSSEEYRDLS